MSGQTGGAGGELVFRTAAQTLARRVGLRLDAGERGRLERSVREEAEARRSSVEDYVASLARDAQALQGLLDRVTVQETSFFRDPAQFEALAEHVVPTLPPPVTIWSAGCSNGQEPYSLAMVLEEAGVPEWRVIATDISTKAIERTERGRYAERELRGLSPRRRDRHLRRVDGEWEVVPSLRERVTVLRHNLAAEPPPFDPGTCPVVFCRNVLIYFTERDLLAVLHRLDRWLPPAGFLFLGFSESLWQVTDAFRAERIGEAFVYRPASAAAPAVERDRPRRSPEPGRPRREAPSPRTSDVSRPRRRPLAAAMPGADGGGEMAALLSAGEAALSAGALSEAVDAFRRAVYLDPERPVAHLYLGLALEAAGDHKAATRAYAAARAAVDRNPTAEVETALEGYRVEELCRLLEDKLGR